MYGTSVQCSALTPYRRWARLGVCAVLWARHLNFMVRSSTRAIAAGVSDALAKHVIPSLTPPTVRATEAYRCRAIKIKIDRYQVVFVTATNTQSRNNKRLMSHNGCHSHLVMTWRLAPEGCRVPACDCQSRVSKMWHQHNTVNYTTLRSTMGPVMTIT